MGTFISPDPVIPDPTKVFAYNRYMYAYGNPLKHNDPTGHCDATTVMGPAGLVIDIPCYAGAGSAAAGGAAIVGGTVVGAVGIAYGITYVLSEPALDYPYPLEPDDQVSVQEPIPYPDSTTLRVDIGGYVLDENIAPGISGIESVPDASELIIAEIAPSESPIWQELQPYRGKTRTNGLTGKKARYYTWDYQLDGEVEVFDRYGNHLGVIDPVTGEHIKDAVPGRTNDDVKK